jgi:transposase
MPFPSSIDDREVVVSAVVIGVDPAKRSHAIEVIDDRERTQAAGVFDNDNAGYRQMREIARRFSQRVWAVEGAGGVGKQLAQRLVADGETVIDVPPKLSTRVRAMTTGHGRKTDPTDARAVAIVALRNTNLTHVLADDETVALRLLSERRRDLVRSRTQAVSRLHQVLMELIPSGASRNLTATKAKQLLATVRPRDVAGKARRQLAADYIDDVVVLDRKLKAVEARIKEAVDATGTTLTEIVGVGHVTAAMILGEVGNVARFPSNNHFASYTGTAPLDASSGDVVRHRLSRAGNRQLNHALHMIAIAHRRFDPRGRDYYARKLAAGKGSKGALRCLKRRLSDVVYRHLIDDATAKSPGGQSGASLQSSAADLIPAVSTSEQPLPGLRPDPTPVAAAVS